MKKTDTILVQPTNRQSPEQFIASVIDYLHMTDKDSQIHVVHANHIDIGSSPDTVEKVLHQHGFNNVTLRAESALARTLIDPEESLRTAVYGIDADIYIIMPTRPVHYQLKDCIPFEFRLTKKEVFTAA
jgi:hypothetical protein